MAVVSAARVAREHGFATEDDRIVVTAGIPFGVAGSTNILRVATANERAIFEGGGEDYQGDAQRPVLGRQTANLDVGPFDDRKNHHIGRA